MIEVKDLHKSFGDTHILKGISTTFEKSKNQFNHRSKWLRKNRVFKMFVGPFWIRKR